MAQFIDFFLPLIVALGILSAIFCTLYFSPRMYRAYNSWSLRDHPVELLLRYALDLMAREPEAFTARHDCGLEVRSNKYQISATSCSLRIQQERLALNDSQQERLKQATNALYAAKGGTRKQFMPLWLSVSGAANVVTANFRRRA